MVPATQPLPAIEGLPDLGAPWQLQWCVNLRCISGADAGVEVTYKASTDGGVKAVAALVEEIQERLATGVHGDVIVPIVLLKKSTYPHDQFGTVWIPILETVAWMGLNGPPPAPASTSSPSTE